MKISSVLKNIAEASSDLTTLRKKVHKPSLVSFIFCKNLRLFSSTNKGCKLQRLIDVGANEGQFAFMARYCWPSTQIDCFEPDPSAFSKLSITHGNDSKITLNNFAIGSVGGELPLNLGNTSAQNSFLIEKSKTSSESVTVTVKTLDEIYQEIDLSNSLLKIDVQGYEMEVLKGASIILKKLSFILVEVSLANIFSGGPQLDDIWQFLVQHGYAYYNVIDQYRNPKNQQVLQMDILFERVA